MKEKISNLQFMFFVANFIFSSAVISLPQIIVQIAGQNAWLVPIIAFPFLIAFLYLVLGKKSKLEYLQNLFIIGNKGKGSEKLFLLFFLLLTVIVFLQDLRGLIDFIASYLLPSTPVDMLMVLSVFIITYIGF